MRLFQSIVLVGVLLAPGCCSTRDAETSVSTDDYKAALNRVRTNLVDNIRPSVAEIMSADTTHLPEWKEAKLDLIDDTVTLIDDTLAGKNAGTATGAGQ